MRARIIGYERPGLILRARRRSFTIAYGEILTAERLQSRRRLRLHVRTLLEPVDVRAGDGGGVEQELRARGVRIVDCWGAIIAPTLDDFEHELAQEPTHVRQSSDDA